MKTRKQYLNNEITHEEYFSQFVDNNVKNTVIMFIGLERIKQSKDKNFNDIPLAYWDAMHGAIGPYCYPKLTKAGDVNGCTISNTVCIAKQAAKIIKKEVQS